MLGSRAEGRVPGDGGLVSTRGREGLGRQGPPSPHPHPPRPGLLTPFHLGRNRSLYLLIIRVLAVT